MRKKPVVIALGALLAVGLVAGGLWAWHTCLSHPRIRPGMTSAQVEAILGPPDATDEFPSNPFGPGPGPYVRWLYRGPGGPRDVPRASVFFGPDGKVMPHPPTFWEQVSDCLGQ